jgi:hypothetical protein
MKFSRAGQGSALGPSLEPPSLPLHSPLAAASPGGGLGRSLVSARTPTAAALWPAPLADCRLLLPPRSLAYLMQGWRQAALAHPGDQAQRRGAQPAPHRHGLRRLHVHGCVGLGAAQLRRDCAQAVRLRQLSRQAGRGAPECLPARCARAAACCQAQHAPRT